MACLCTIVKDHRMTVLQLLLVLLVNRIRFECLSILIVSEWIVEEYNVDLNVQVKHKPPEILRAGAESLPIEHVEIPDVP